MEDAPDIGAAIDRLGATALEWKATAEAAMERLEDAERVIECADFALNIFADEPVETKTAMTETEHILMAARKETNAYQRRLAKEQSGG